MIEINLLPQELKAVERTPLPRIVSIYVGVAIACALGYFIYDIHTIQIPAVKARWTEKDNALKLLEPKLKEYRDLTAEKNRFVLRKKTVESLIASRNSIFENLDRLTSTISESNVWITSLNIDKPAASRARRRVPTRAELAAAKAGGKRAATPVLTMSMKCKLKVEESVMLEDIADFFKTFQNDEYWSQAALPPAFNGVRMSEGIGNFDLKLQLLPPAPKPVARKAPIRRPAPAPHAAAGTPGGAR